MLGFVLALFVPTVSFAFDYGPVGNGVFWVVLAGWSAFVSYILLKKRASLWGGIARFASALLSPGVRPQRPAKNPHIVAEHVQNSDAPHTPHRPHVVGTAGKSEIGAVALTNSHYAKQSVPHTSVTRALHTVAAPTSHTESVVHSTPMPTPHIKPAAPATSKIAPKPVVAVPPAPPAQATKDTLTLEVVAGVPKLILKREKK